ncbi:MAG: hypothetical protein AAB974_01320 [Patescibacteria group bacterium]
MTAPASAVVPASRSAGLPSTKNGVPASAGDVSSGRPSQPALDQAITSIATATLNCFLIASTS